MSSHIEITPTKNKKRIELLDVFRGFAVFGIFAVNIEIMNCTFLNEDSFSQQWTSFIDEASVRILQLFFYTKFFPIFSLLFGLGISLQALKLYERKKLSFSFFGRRMFILFLIGVMHIVFLWSGDVLNLYAMLGLLTTLLIKRSNKLILGLSLFFLFFPFYDQVFEFLVGLLNYNPEVYLKHYAGAEVIRVIRHGSYPEGIKLRLLEYLSNIPVLFVFLAPVALAMFLLGLYLGKKGVLDNLEVFMERIKKPAIIIAVITNIYRILFLFFLPNHEIYSNETLRPIFFKLMVLSDIAMGMFYLWLISWFWHRTQWKRMLLPLRHVGRMALTNYIMHSFIGLILFSSVGFQLYETMSPSETLLTAATVFSFQVIYSKLWLSYFKYGPLEWVWRCFTYKKVLPIKKSSVSEFGYSN